MLNLSRRHFVVSAAFAAAGINASTHLIGEHYGRYRLHVKYWGSIPNFMVTNRPTR